MFYIPNNKYITINKNGLFVGEKNAICYRGRKIGFVNHVKENFAKIQAEYPEIKEFHVGAFGTMGEYANVREPSRGFGLNAWCRVKLFDNRLGHWVFYNAYSSIQSCIHNCAYDCVHGFRYYYLMRSSMLNFETDKEENKTASVFDDSAYRITIEKIVQKQK